MREEAEKVIPTGTPPEVYERIVEKIKVERPVKRKAKLPFLPAKEEKEIKWERKVSFRPVEVNPQELGRGYAEAGMTLAGTMPAMSGEKGMSIFGTEIPVRESESEGIFIGKNLEEYGTKIRAEAAGFYRNGENWIELFPYIAHRFSVFASEDGSTCLLDFTPGTGTAALPDPEAILRECRSFGIQPEELLSGDELKELLTEAVSGKTPIKRKSLNPGQDAEIRITISPDKQEAHLTLRKGKGGGKALSLKEIGDSIRRAGLKGMDAVRVKKNLLEFYHAEELTLENYPLVEGRQPGAGQDGKIEWLCRFFDKGKVAELKKQFEERSDRIRDLKSLPEFSILKIEDLAIAIERGKVALIEPPTAGEPGVDVFGVVLPGEKGKEVQLKLYENVQLIRNEVIATCAGLLEKGTREGTVVLRARPHKDCEISLEISEDRMKAFLTLVPATGTGLPLSPDSVHKEVEKQGVVKGIKDSLLAELILKAQGGEAVESRLFAEGLPSRHGKNRDLVLHIKKATGASVTITEEGRADYKRQDKITLVKKGALVAELPPPAETQDGWDVTGKTLPAKEGAPASIQVGKNVETREEEDGSIKFISKTTGELFFDRNFMDVLNVHTIKGDVSLKTGNIKFTGSVRVTGSVQSGFSVMAGESIIIDENIQGALLSAEDSILVQKGIKGEGKAILRAKRNINAYFAEQAILLAVGEIRITNACLRCQIKCNSKLQLESEKGHIVGGRVRAKNGLIAVNIGSKRGVKTEIFFGQDYLIADRIELEAKEIEKIKSKNQELDFAMKRLDRALHPDRAALEKIRKDKLYNMKILEKRTHRIFNLRERFETHFPSEIVVKGTVFPGVVLESHDRKLELKTEKKRVMFIFNPKRGKIEEKPLTKQA